MKYSIVDEQGNISDDPVDRYTLKIDEKNLLPFLGNVAEGTFACYGSKLVKITVPESLNAEDMEDEDDIVEVESVFDISMCKLHAIQIINTESTQ